jgi:hypothetical protein
MGALFGNVKDILSQVISPVNQPTQDSGITSLPINTQPINQSSPIRGYNQVRDPRLNRTAMRPMFRTSKYDNRIGDLLNRLMPQTENKADGGRIGYADGTPAAGLVFNPEPYEGPYSGPYIVGGPRPGQYYSEPGSSLTSLNVPRSDLYKMTTANIMPGTGGFPGGPLQQESIREALMSLPITRSNPLMNTLRKFNQVRDPRIARLLQQRQARAMGGIMNLKVGGLPAEMDYRASGGFVPIGKKERADDVPARLSKNEFVFTANAVRNAGGGDIRKGAKRMYNLMHQLEAKK